MLRLTFLFLLIASLAVAAPTTELATRHFIPTEQYDNNPIFSPATYSNLSEWFAAQRRIYDTANATTHECLAQYAESGDDSACFDDEHWTWNPIAYICCIGVMAAPAALLWLVWDWGWAVALWAVNEKDGMDEEGDPYLIGGATVDEEKGLQGEVQKQERKVSRFSEAATRVNSVAEEGSTGSKSSTGRECEGSKARLPRSSSCPHLAKRSSRNESV